MSPDFLFIFLPLVFLVVGAALVWFGRRNRLLAKASARWPFVNGAVTDATVVMRRRSKGGTRFVPTISYSYDVAGRRYCGSRLAFGSTERVTEQAAQAVLAPYAVGKTVAVHYDPADPSVSTLSTSVTGTLVTELLGWALVAMAIVIGGIFGPLNG